MSPIKHFLYAKTATKNINVRPIFEKWCNIHVTTADERTNKAASSISTSSLITKCAKERKVEDRYRYENGTQMKIQLKMFRRDFRKPHFTTKLHPKGGRCSYSRLYNSPSSWAIWGDEHSKLPKGKLAECDSPWFKWTLENISFIRECKIILDILELDSSKIRGSADFLLLLYFH